MLALIFINVAQARLVRVSGQLPEGERKSPHAVSMIARTPAL
jgi:hypothetical protein